MLRGAASIKRQQRPRRYEALSEVLQAGIVFLMGGCLKVDNSLRNSGQRRWLCGVALALDHVKRVDATEGARMRVKNIADACVDKEPSL